MTKFKCSFDFFQSICRKRLFVWAGLLLIGGLLAHPAHASQDRFGGVFHKGNDPHNLHAGVTWQELGNLMAQYGKRRQKLIDVEIIQRQSLHPDRCEPPTFAGVWREGDYGQSLIGGLIWKYFKKEFKQQHKYGMKLIDLETHVECGVRKYVGVFSQGFEPQKVKTGMSWKQFTKKYSSMHKHGWHLIDIETYKDNGMRYWAAVWNKGYKDEYVYMLPRKDFEIIQEYLDGSQQLVDMESWRIEGNRMIIGLFYGSPDPAIMETGENWQKFIPLWDNFSTDEKRLVDLEVYPDTTDRRWENTFFQVLNGNAMGWSFAVVESGVLAEIGAEGWARSPNELVNPSVLMKPDSVMNVASVTKLLTVVGILELHEQLGETFNFIDWPIGYYLQAYYSNIDPYVLNVTIRDVLTQKTGMQEPGDEDEDGIWDPPGNDYAQRIGSWLAMPLVGTPGTGKASYYNHYFNLLILIIEAATAQDYQVWMNQNIYAQLGIGQLGCSPSNLLSDPLYYQKLPDNGFGAFFNQPGDTCFEGAGNGGCWYASAIDLARLVASFRDGTILEPATVQMMENETMAWYPWGPHYQKNGGLCDGNIRGLGTDVMALDDDFDVGIIVNSWTSNAFNDPNQPPISLENLIVQAHDAPEDW
ncbi:MAG: serine hydrolase [Deltaproteobacteria bacterium]|nr:serine hydrolase [Deltaproteobacteria bacterium]